MRVLHVFILQFYYIPAFMCVVCVWALAFGGACVLFACYSGTVLMPQGHSLHPQRRVN